MENTMDNQTNLIEVPPDEQVQQIIDSVANRIKQDFPDAFEKDLKFQSFLTLDSFKNLFETLAVELIELNKKEETPYNLRDMITSLYADAHKKIYGFKGTPENEDLAAMAVEYVMLHLSAETLFEDENLQAEEEQKFTEVFQLIEKEIQSEKDIILLAAKIVEIIKKAEFESEYTRDRLISETVTYVEEYSIANKIDVKPFFQEFQKKFFVNPEETT
jgi:hypothetical protein